MRLRDFRQVMPFLMSDPVTFKAEWNCCRMPGSRRIPWHAQDGHRIRGPCDRRIVAGERGGDYAARGQVLGAAKEPEKEEFFIRAVCSPPGVRAFPSAAWSGSFLGGPVEVRQLINTNRDGDRSWKACLSTIPCLNRS